jgi:long-chain acyl-CoA synthetase
VRREFQERWGVTVGQLYGATELGTVAVGRPDEPGFQPSSIGPALPGVSFRLVPVVGDSASTSQLAVSAPSMLSCYLDGDVPLEDGHFLTGDLAALDSEGRLSITGRLKLLIDVGGFKVNPLEVEASLREHPEVRDCAIVPLALSDTVVRPRALIVPVDPATPPRSGDLRAFLRERLAPAKIPRSFDVVDSLPRSPMGKLVRHELPGWIP